MHTIAQIYVNGAFVQPQGTEVQELRSPVTGAPLGRVVLGNEADARSAVAAAKAAFKTFSRTTREERRACLERIHAAVSARRQELAEVMMLEYGAPLAFSSGTVQNALDSIRANIRVLESFDFERTAGSARVQMMPVGVVGIITPWNASNGFICGKLSTAIAAGCTAVIKPSELSALQTQVLTECLHEAGLPAGIFNIVNGLGNVVGAELTRHKDVAKISFTGSTAIGKAIARDGAATLKRITLELGGKSPHILLDDADLDTAIPLALQAAFMNSGQACIAGSRLLVPEARLPEIKEKLRYYVAGFKVGAPQDPDTRIGPMVSRKQYDRVQHYIQAGIAEGATLLEGGPGHPPGLEAGNFVKPTIFTGVHNDMRIAREEIFGPVLCVLTYRTEEEAVAIANDTDYGLAAYVQGNDEARTGRIALQLEAGRVAVNGFKHDPMAPFGGFKQSGIGREYGVYGLEAYLEPRAILS